MNTVSLFTSIYIFFLSLHCLCVFQVPPPPFSLMCLFWSIFDAGGFPEISDGPWWLVHNYKWKKSVWKHWARVGGLKTGGLHQSCTVRQITDAVEFFSWAGQFPNEITPPHSCLGVGVGIEEVEAFFSILPAKLGKGVGARVVALPFSTSFQWTHLH